MPEAGSTEVHDGTDGSNVSSKPPSAKRSEPNSIKGCEFCLIEASGLLPVDSVNLTNPFVVATCTASVKWRSKGRKKTLSPQWKERAFLPMDVDCMRDLYVLVYDIGRNNEVTFIGGTKLQLKLDAINEPQVFDLALGASHPDDEQELEVKRLAKAMRSTRPNDFGRIQFSVAAASAKFEDIIGQLKGADYQFVRVPGAVGQRVSAALTGISSEIDEHAVLMDKVYDNMRQWMISDEHDHDWDALDFASNGLVSLRLVDELCRTKFPEIWVDGLILRTYEQLYRSEATRNPVHTLRSWVDYQMFVPLVTMTYYFKRGFDTVYPLKLEKSSKGKKKTEPRIEIREFRAILKRCGIRMTDNEAQSWFTALDLVDMGKAGDGSILLSRALHYIASKMFPWPSTAPSPDYEPQQQVQEVVTTQRGRKASFTKTGRSKPAGGKHQNSSKTNKHKGGGSINDKGSKVKGDDDGASGAGSVKAAKRPNPSGKKKERQTSRRGP